MDFEQKITIFAWVFLVVAVLLIPVGVGVFLIGPAIIILWRVYKTKSQANRRFPR
jgi:hypothetical protein